MVIYNKVLAQEQLEIRCLAGTDKAADSGSVVSSHLTDLFEQSVISLNGARLLIEYADVFTTYDSDLGKISVIEHKIDTDNARPV